MCSPLPIKLSNPPPQSDESLVQRDSELSMDSTLEESTSSSRVSDQENTAPKHTPFNSQLPTKKKISSKGKKMGEAKRPLTSLTNSSV